MFSFTTLVIFLQILSQPSQNSMGGIMRLGTTSTGGAISGVSAIHGTLLKVGDRVRVKSSVVTPKYKWGSVNHNSIGVVTSVSPNGRDVNVGFSSLNLYQNNSRNLSRVSIKSNVLLPLLFTFC